MKIATLILALVLSNSLFAWGKNGHRTVAQIAENHLDAKVLKELRALLDGSSLPAVSTWADEIKSDPSWNFVKTWHYVNISAGKTYEAMDKEKDGDLIQAISKIVADLKNPKTARKDKQNSLKLLVHFVGDLHQPLHAGRPEDRGGNDTEVSWFGGKTNLHAVWDEKLFESQALSYTEYAKIIDIAPLDKVSQFQNGDIISWATDSNKIAGELGELPSTKLSYEYSYKYKDLMESQLLKGGVRLAKILNEIF